MHSVLLSLQNNLLSFQIFIKIYEKYSKILKNTNFRLTGQKPSKWPKKAQKWPKTAIFATFPKRSREGYADPPKTAKKLLCSLEPNSTLLFEKRPFFGPSKIGLNHQNSKPIIQTSNQNFSTNSVWPIKLSNQNKSMNE